MKDTKVWRFGLLKGSVLMVIRDIGLYFAVISFVYAFSLGVPSLLALPTTAGYFAMLGVLSLGVVVTTLLSSFDISYSLQSGVGSFIFSMIPFFIAIACGHPGYIAFSLFNFSATSISILTLYSVSLVTSLCAIFYFDKTIGLDNVAEFCDKMDNLSGNPMQATEFIADKMEGFLNGNINVGDDVDNLLGTFGP